MGAAESVELDQAVIINNFFSVSRLCQTSMSRLHASRTAVKDKMPLRVSAACHPESDRTGVRRNVYAEAPDPGVSAPDVER